MLEYWLGGLCDAGFERILINVHHHAQLVSEFIASSRYAENVSTVYEAQLLGTAGTLLANAHFFGDAPTLVAHGDNLSIFDVAGLMNAHRDRPRDCEMTMMTFAAQDPSSCGIVEVSPRGIVTAFHEKVANPPGNTANAAVYVVQPSIIEFLRGFQKNVIDFSTEVIPAFMNRIFAYHNDRYHRDIGTLESLVMAQFEYPVARASLAGTGIGQAAGKSFYAEEQPRWARLLRSIDTALRRAAPRGISGAGD